MYSAIKSVQILVALLKEYQYKHVVISPGGNNIPVVHSIENDAFFKCYSVVDERSAAYFAMGLSQQLEEPVILVCTSGTAVCNYLPGVTEAHYQRVPLIIITTDRSPYMLEQLETQKIDQMNIFGPVVNKDVCLPTVRSDDDFWYCERLINEALIEIDHKNIGPVHINVPTNGGSPLDYSCEFLPKVNKINLISQKNLSDNKVILLKKIKNKKVLLILGENYKDKNYLSEKINLFCSKYGIVCLKDYISNYSADGIYSYRITESFKDSDFMEKLLPDLVITFSNNILSNNLKRFLRNGKIEHWCVDKYGQIRDVFKHLTYLFECEEDDFLDFFINQEIEKVNLSYRNEWNNAKEKTDYSKIDFSGLSSVKTFVENIPNDSIVHTAILNSTRALHLFDINKIIKVYSNIGALGIDGCLSTFIGHSFATDKKCFLIIGDLSFFYDMNALGITGIKNNVRILLLNNGGGAEFHFNMGKENIPTLNDYISVKHGKIAKGWAESVGFKYLPCYSQEDVNKNINIFVNDSNCPILMEIFTDMEEDARVVRKNINSIASKRSSKSKIKEMVKTVLRK